MQLAAVDQQRKLSIRDLKAKVARRNGRRNLAFTHRSRQINLYPPERCGNVRTIINSFDETIVRVDGEIPTDLPVEGGDRFLFISHDQSVLTHGLHKYPAKFFPELPRWLISRYSRERQRVLDPFSGSGTTNVEALLLRRNSVGIDVDPFSRFIAKVKVTPLDTDQLEKASDRILRSLERYRGSEVTPSDVPSFPYRDSWFNREIVSELAFIRKRIEALEVDVAVKNFLKVCFSSIIRAVSNADDNCTRTVIRKRLNKKVHPSDALRKFAEAVIISVPKMNEFSKRCPRDIQTIFPEDMDARSIDYRAGYFDLAVTSPPYANAVDYPRTHQLESYWLGLAHGSLTPLKRRHVGTESVLHIEYKDLHRTGLREADEVISRIFQKDPRRAYIAYKYLADMQRNLREVHRVLKVEGRYVIVVGNNRVPRRDLRELEIRQRACGERRFRARKLFRFRDHQALHQGPEGGTDRHRLGARFEEDRIRWGKRYDMIIVLKDAAGRENYDILERCKESDYVLRMCEEYGIISRNPG